jgi:hypothetical protein
MELAVIQAEQGYLAEASVDVDGTIRLREHNCAIYHVARATPAACQAELELFRDVLGADVVQDPHRLGRSLLHPPIESAPGIEPLPGSELRQDRSMISTRSTHLSRRVRP